MGEQPAKRGRNLSRESVGRIMRGNRSKNTNPELLVRKALREMGWAGYRLHWRGAAGRPDIAFPGRRIAVFVHGCFWHRCPMCALPTPTSNPEFWEEKFARNTARDAALLEQLRIEGWRVFVIWECEAKRDSTRALADVTAALEETRRPPR